VPVLTGLSIFSDARYREAAGPLFDSEEVEAVEWSVDGWNAPSLPQETVACLKIFGEQDKLIAHGIHYPLLAVDANDLRAAWLEKLKQDVQVHRYCGLSVHFGFATGWEIIEGAPLPVPYCPEAVALGKKTLQTLAKTAGCRVGIENLALAFSKQDVLEQGRFIEELLHDVDGYLLLDLHNIYCQSVNFGIPMLDLVKTYPLARVLEIHVSGGSWSEHGGQQVRRDTHDGRLPDALLEALPAVMALCPNLRFIFLEKLPHSFESDDDVIGFQQDYRRLKETVHHARR
jgi:uncharacterized protein (UPF0276 family)